MNSPSPGNFKVAYLSFGLAFLLQLVYITSFIKDLQHADKANQVQIEELKALAVENRIELTRRSETIFQINHIQKQLNRIEAQLSGIRKEKIH